MTDEESELKAETEKEEDKDKEKAPDPLLTEASHILVDALPYFQPERLARRP